MWRGVGLQRQQHIMLDITCGYGEAARQDCGHIDIAAMGGVGGGTTAACLHVYHDFGICKLGTNFSDQGWIMSSLCMRPAGGPRQRPARRLPPLRLPLEVQTKQMPDPAAGPSAAA